jgi:hypothetical protein
VKVSRRTCRLKRERKRDFGKMEIEDSSKIPNEYITLVLSSASWWTFLAFALRAFLACMEAECTGSVFICTSGESISIMRKEILGKE